MLTIARRLLFSEGRGSGGVQRGGSKDNICVSPCLPNDNTQWNSHTDQYFSMYLMIWSFRSNKGKVHLVDFSFLWKNRTNLDVNVDVRNEYYEAN